MPKAVTKLIVTVGASLALTPLIGAGAAFAIGAIAGTLVSTAIFGSGRPKPSDGQVNFDAAVGSRTRHYGIVHTGGQRTFGESRDGTLAQVITLGTDEESEILEHRINDKVVTLDGSGTVTESRYKGAIHIHTRPGTDDQTAIAELTAAFPEWTSNHRQRGCAHAAIIADPVDQEDFSAVYNSQVPQYSQVRKAAKVYDPRKDSTQQIGVDGSGDPVFGAGTHRLADRSTWEWSDNAELVTIDYTAHEDGYGGGYDNINWMTTAAEADIADQTVSTVGAEIIARWRIWASYSLASEERRKVLSAMQLACDGFSWMDAEGKFNHSVGRYVAPTVTLRDDHFLAFTAKLGGESRHRVSAVKMLYTEAAIGYREQEAATISHPSIDTDPNTDPKPIEAFFAPHHNQASRLGKIYLYQLGERWHITGLVNLFGLNLLGERTCRVELAQMGISADFKVERLRLNLAQLNIEVTLAEIEEADWEFDAATEEGTPPASTGPAVNPPALAVPTGLALSAVQVSLGETNGVEIAATWNDPGRLGIAWEARQRPTGGGDWVPMQVDQANRTARSGPVNSGTEYEVQIRALTITGRPSAWSASATITPVASNALQPPTDLAAVAGGSAGEADVSWRNPFGASFDHVKVFESTTDDIGTASQIGTNFAGGLGALVSETFTGLSAGTHYFWARAYDGATTETAATGSVSATVT